MSTLSVSGFIVFLTLMSALHAGYADPFSVYTLRNLTRPHPYIGNGHLATGIFHPFVYIQGLYTTGNDNDTRRVAVPSSINIRFDRSDAADRIYRLHMDKGYFEVVIRTPTHVLTQRMYCHLWLPEILIMEVEVMRHANSTNARLEVPYTLENVLESPDVKFDDVTSMQELNQHIQVQCQTGRRGIVNICVVGDILDSSFIPDRGTTMSRNIYITSFDTDKEAALEKYVQARKEASTGILWSRHVDAWNWRWNRGQITFQPQMAANQTPNASAVHLAQAVHASMYYLLSSIPEHPQYAENFPGLSKDGLSSNDDLGRIRWEQELYMFLPLLLFHQDTAEQILNSRLNNLAAALANARPLYRGARYPYETASSGRELAANFSRTLFTSGAVALNMQQYLYTMGSAANIGGENAVSAARAIADLYAGATQASGAVAGIQNIKGTVTFNDALTNALAIVGLTLPQKLGPGVNGTYQNVAERIAADNFPMFRNCHAANGNASNPGALAPTDYSYEPDALLVYWPVGNQRFFNSGLLLNDLTCHKEATISRTTYNLLRLTLYQIAAKSANTSGQINPDVYAAEEIKFQQLLNWTSRHFGIIPESIDSRLISDPTSPGANLSLPGAGALLQLVLFGYAGISLHPDRLTLNPRHPPGVESWTLRGVDYRGFTLTVSFLPTSIHIRAQKNRKEPVRLQVRVDGWLREVPEEGVTIRWGEVQVTTIMEKEAEEHWDRDPFLMQTNSLPTSRFLPEIGNGHIASVVHAPWLHMNGLYNGAGSRSSRARIPSLIAFNISLQDATLANQSFTLNLREGIYTERKQYVNPDVLIEREMFAHRLYPSLLIARIKCNRTAPASGAVQPPASSDLPVLLLDGLLDESQLESDDIVFKATIRPKGQRIKVARGETLIPETTNSTFSPVIMAWNSSVELRDYVTIPANGLEIIQYVSISSDEDAAVSNLSQVLKYNYNTVRGMHIEKWGEYWENGRITVEAQENFPLAQAVNAAFYYLLSSLPNYEEGNGSFVGLSPGGLARGAPGAEIDQDYLGHIFWDTEIWMFPPILLFHPEQAHLLLHARTRVLEAARANAASTGYQGARFPWESALTGSEVTPWPPAAQYQLHVTADVALAVRQYLYAIADKAKAIHELRLDVLVEDIAAFWQSRVTCDSRVINNDDVDHICHINEVMGPDEYHYPVNDSAFTNYAAKLALTLPEYVLPIIGKKHPDIDKWFATAEDITMTESRYKGQPYHPQFKGFVPNEWHPASSKKKPVVKQADTILLGYPLDMDMPVEMRANDLNIYEELTSPNGPAMTWAMFAIGHLELKNKMKADNLFNRYKDNYQQPFGVWSEEPGGSGAVNFLTGMGGFLQSVLNGYGGLRLREDSLHFDPADLPGSSRWSIHGLKYLGHTLDLTFDFLADTINVSVSRTVDIDLVLETESGKIFLLKDDTRLSYRREASTIRMYHPEFDVIRDPVSGEITGPSSLSPAQLLPSLSVLLALIFMIVYSFPEFF
ncbi:uncharacterized protein LOC129589014 [Paramacrobiotus metropolitanus]|uniref:uncharacterized protein LOC129589014 n=1 Tax=Paramacrobiotus metropolitanus TaxID=2943436 RepID=UPI0024457EA3|nr:uncharacterized protein LOC129589014 [Paramacrobiotus metropolitanus]